LDKGDGAGDVLVLVAGALYAEAGASVQRCTWA